jgi:hypothetical protein
VAIPFYRIWHNQPKTKSCLLQDEPEERPISTRE